MASSDEEDVEGQASDSDAAPPAASPRRSPTRGRRVRIVDGVEHDPSATKVLELEDELSEEDDAYSEKGNFVTNLWDADDVGATPSTVPRRCTDIFWLVIYLLYSSVIVRIGFYVFPLRKPGALLTLSDWRNDHCGLGENANKSLLFFCLKDTDAMRRRLNMYYPICVNECPTHEFEGLFECPRNVRNDPFTTTTFTTTRITSTSVLQTIPPPAYPPPSPYQAYWKPISEAERGGVYEQQGWYPSPLTNPYATAHYPGPYNGDDNYWPSHSHDDFPPYLPPHQGSTNPFATYPAKKRRIMEEFVPIEQPHMADENIVLSDWRGNFTLIEVSGYASHAFVGMVCLPWSEFLADQAETFVEKTPLVRYFATLIHAYQPLIVAALSGIVLSYVYITLLRFRASVLVRGGLATLILGPLCFGAYFIWCWRKETCPMSTGNKLGDGASGFFFIAIGLTFLAVSCRLGDNVEMAISCIEWSCKAVLETPSLKLEPVLALACRGLVDAAAILLVACIWTSELEGVEAAQAQYQSLLPPQSNLQIGMCVLVAFWCLWSNWIITAISDFVIMYTTEQWFFNGGMDGGGHAPCCSILRAYFVCLRYHFGTMIVGGIFVGAVQPVRLTLGFIHAAVEVESNSVIGVLGCCCICVSDLYTMYLEPLSRNAYMDLALNARDFWPSASHAADINSSQADTIHILNGATWLFQVAGLGAITFLGNLQTWLIMRYYPGFLDKYSPVYVQDPAFLALGGAVASFTMAFPFMMIFDTVSDTILFCWIVHNQRAQEKEKKTLFQRACGFAETFDDFFGANCLSSGRRFQAMPDADAEERPVSSKRSARSQTS